jgi:hypothetical protein
MLLFISILIIIVILVFVFLLIKPLEINCVSCSSSKGLFYKCKPQSCTEYNNRKQSINNHYNAIKSNIAQLGSTVSKTKDDITSSIDKINSNIVGLNSKINAVVSRSFPTVDFSKIQIPHITPPSGCSVQLGPFPELNVCEKLLAPINASLGVINETVKPLADNINSNIANTKRFIDSVMSPTLDFFNDINGQMTQSISSIQTEMEALIVELNELSKNITQFGFMEYIYVKILTKIQSVIPLPIWCVPYFVLFFILIQIIGAGYNILQLVDMITLGPFRLLFSL